MKKLLITGFTPFGGEKINPSFEAVKRLRNRIGEYELFKLEIPTVYGEAAEQVITAAQRFCPDVIVCVGQAGGRKAVTPEVIGINLREAAIPDNAGVLFSGAPIERDGPAAYFSTLPVRKMVASVRAEHIPCSLSYSAGAFVCNDVLYSLLHKYSGSETLVGFVHVPFLPEQAGDGVFSMPLDTIIKALEAAIEAI